MSEHLLTNIEIKDFKCFKDFKAEGFKRVNLIGGKNNVGKTAFMEACCINTYAQSINHFKEILIHIKVIREKINLLFQEYKINERDILELSNHIFTKSNINTVSFSSNDKNGENIYTFRIKDIETKINSNQFSAKNEVMENIRFIDSFGFSNKEIIVNYSAIQKKKKEKYLNNILNRFDNRIESFKIMIDKPMCEIKGIYYEVTELGDGTKHLVSIITALFKCEKGYLFIDEVENGIHYTQLDRLWEIILTVSKEQNVQVFATTHSKECIDSYARVVKKLEDEDIAFIELGKNKKNELDSIVMNSEMFLRHIEMGNEVRGW